MSDSYLSIDLDEELISLSDSDESGESDTVLKDSENKTDEIERVPGERPLESQNPVQPSKRIVIGQIQLVDDIIDSVRSNISGFINSILESKINNNEQLIEPDNKDKESTTGNSNLIERNIFHFLSSSEFLDFLTENSNNYCDDLKCKPNSMSRCASAPNLRPSKDISEIKQIGADMLDMKKLAQSDLKPVDLVTEESKDEMINENIQTDEEDEDIIYVYEEDSLPELINVRSISVNSENLEYENSDDDTDSIEEEVLTSIQSAEESKSTEPNEIATQEQPDGNNSEEIQTSEDNVNEEIHNDLEDEGSGEFVDDDDISNPSSENIEQENSIEAMNDFVEEEIQILTQAEESKSPEPNEIVTQERPTTPTQVLDTKSIIIRTNNRDSDDGTENLITSTVGIGSVVSQCQIEDSNMIKLKTNCGCQTERSENEFINTFLERIMATGPSLLNYILETEYESESNWFLRNANRNSEKDPTENPPID